MNPPVIDFDSISAKPDRGVQSDGRAKPSAAMHSENMPPPSASTCHASRRAVGNRGDVAHIVAVGLLLGAIGCAAGCSMPRRTFQPEQEPATLDDISFLHYLATVPVVTVDEGMQAVFLLTGERGQWPTFERRYEELQRRGAIKTVWRLEADRILSKGTLAYMLRTVCDLPRSVNEVVASRSRLGDRRYALKTCVDEGILPYGLSHDPVTGAQLHSALIDSERYMASRSSHTP